MTCRVVCICYVISIYYLHTMQITRHVSMHLSTPSLKMTAYLHTTCLCMYIKGLDQNQKHSWGSGVRALLPALPKSLVCPLFPCLRASKRPVTYHATTFMRRGYVRVCVSANVGECLCMRMCVCDIFVSVEVCMYVRECVYIYIYMYVCVYIYM